MDSSPTENVQWEQRCRRLEGQITTMKQISSLRKNLLELREKQAKSLISKLKHYEVIVTEERESRHSLSSRLQSAETQCAQLTERLTQNVQTIDEMKANYENKVTTLINELQTSEQRNKQLSDQLSKGCSIEELAKRLDEKDKLIAEMQRQTKKVWQRNKAMSYQMSLLNNLFNETEGVTIDFEKIKAIGDIVRESQTYAEDSDDLLSDDQDAEMRQSTDLEHLLDSMEKSEDVIPADIPGEESCYKSVDTKRGPQLVLSVSRTFIKLKDLIVEKKTLQKEIDTLKSLNTKLESKVDKQEHRLYRVTMELNKTWSLVSKLKQQHKRLYNSEAVLRYELQEKRTLLEKLKNELSVSRDKWRRVRQKNSQSQMEWEKLRDEFAQRKHQSSQESGTFSEVMSISSSGENDVTLEADEIEEAKQNSSRRRGSKYDRPRTLSFSSSNVQAEGGETPYSSTRQPELDHDDVEEGECPEEDFEEGARALSPSEDDNFDDPLEELVSNLVEDIDNEADTEEDMSSAQGSSSRAPVDNENDSSPSPDFEDRMRRRANRLRMLEEQCVLLHQKLHASTARSEALSTKLAELHDHYGPSDSSTGTPNDEHHHQEQEQHQQDGVSNVDEEETESNAAVTKTVSDEETASISTDAAYVSGTDTIGGDSGKSEEEAAPEIDTQPSIPPSPAVAKEPENATSSALPCQESSTSATRELINASENSRICAETVQTKENSLDNNIKSSNVIQQSSQGQSNDDDVVVDTSEKVNCIDSNISADENAAEISCSESGTNGAECDQSCISAQNETASSNESQSQQTTSITLPHDQIAIPESIPQEQQHIESPCVESATSNASPVNPEENDTLRTNVQQSVVEPESNGITGLPEQTIVQENLPTAEISQPHLVEVNPSVDDEPLPIVQETVVQHFPTTTEEEANEFAPVQIRPEFLRILQEADEATNANSLDWMPSLLTITHSVALLRLEPELPSATSSGGGRTSNNGANINSNSSRGTTHLDSSRSLSESLRIEIPRQSPSPPFHPIRQNDNSRAMSRTTSNNRNEHVPTSEEEGEDENGRSLSALRKDPSFLSRMIIKQLPKRLQLLKNENHTLQMEAAEAKMRMKDIKRQLSKEMDKQQQMSFSLDAQIEDKHLIEFELREEIEKKEKVIEELQMEIDESKSYIDELRKEKDETDAYFQILLEEKLDLEAPKVAPETVSNCNNCKRTFSFVTRRKCHCKICGKVYCKDCAIPREPNKRSSKRPRLCTRCHLRRQRLLAIVNATRQKTSEEKH